MKNPKIKLGTTIHNNIKRDKIFRNKLSKNARLVP
jgi:hypothetical protein